jgi:hypothetical protein
MGTEPRTRKQRILEGVIFSIILHVILSVLAVL